jgi:hypothetical protein
MSKPLPHSKPLQNFIKAFEGHVEPSDRKFRRIVSSPINWEQDSSIAYGSAKYEEVEAVALHIPIYKLEDFLESIPEHHYREMEIRMQVPAVKKAYEQYKLLLKMCGGDYDAGY